MNQYVIGDKIKFNSHKALLAKALHLSAEGYGIGILGYHDMFEHILTILQVPDQEEGE